MAASRPPQGTEGSPLLRDELSLDEDPIKRLQKNPTSFRTSQVILVIVLGVAVVALTSGLVFGLVTFSVTDADLDAVTLGVAGDGVPVQGGGIQSATSQYRFAAVAADAGPCSRVATYMMAERRGSVVDAAIAALLCLGIHNAQSTGLGGGSFMVVYDTPLGYSDHRQVAALDARETAPLAATRDMLLSVMSESVGAKAIGVPGEIAGYHEAWKKFGRLPWKDLFAPAVAMCQEGFTIQEGLGNAIQSSEERIRSEPSLAEIFVKPDGNMYETGDVMRRPVLAHTLDTIAKEGVHTFYNGSLAKLILADLHDHGAIITAEDLQSYKALWRRPAQTRLKSRNLTIHTMPPPSSGPVLQYMLNILDGYGFTAADLQGQEAQTRTYHRIVEAFKFGFAEQTYLGDPMFEGMGHVVSNLSSYEYASATRDRITDTRTHPVSFYDPAVHDVMIDSGTSHLSIIGSTGEAVSATSTINSFFGCKKRGRRTGIIFNNEMEDFSSPGDNVKYALSSAHANFIEPGKRPVSSMVPTIITDQEGEVVIVLGGSGGTKILTSVTWVAAHALWLGKSLNGGIDTARIHHTLIPNVLQHEAGLVQEVLDGLAAKGHVLQQKDSLGVVQGIESRCGPCRPYCKEPCLTATSDARKGGRPDGY